MVSPVFVSDKRFSELFSIDLRAYSIYFAPLSIILPFFSFYFLLCLSVRVYHVMAGVVPDRKFFYYGRILIVDFIFLSFILIIFFAGGYIFFNALGYTLKTSGFLKLIHISSYKQILIQTAVYLAVIITIYMPQMIVMININSDRHKHFIKPWFSEGIKFLFKNFKDTIPLIVLLIASICLGILCSSLFTKSPEKWYALYFAETFLVYFLSAYIQIAILYILIKKKWNPIFDHLYKSRNEPPVSSLEKSELVEVFLTNEPPVSFLEKSELIEVFFTYEYLKAKYVASLLDKAGISFVLEPGGENGLDMLKNSEVRSVGFYVEPGESYSEAYRLIEEYRQSKT